MWKATAGHKISSAPVKDDDDWDTDPNFVNDVSEKEQRWGSKTVAGSGHVESVSLGKLREDVQSEDKDAKKRQYESGPKSSFGYGGKFGVESDKKDNSAADYNYKAPLSQHASQVDCVKGFGGKFGVQSDRKDKAALGWDHKESLEKHESQKDYSKGFGGKYGLQTDRQDKSAKGWSEQTQVEKHSSQTDYNKGFGGRYGIEKDKVDECAKGWDEKTSLGVHPSQLPNKSKNIDDSSSDGKGAKTLASKFEQMQTSAPSVPQKLEKKKVQKVIPTEESHNPDIPTDASEYDSVNVPETEPHDTFEADSVPEACGEAESFKETEELEKDEARPNARAVALYDYQAADEDEITFDPGEVIENIEFIDDGWWKGTCNGHTGLFPANYVELQN